jgi:two-component system cell cycle sensor histidine kinase/response regulator CckA
MHTTFPKPPTAVRGNGAISIKPFNILLVEDERFVRDVAAEILRAAGYKVLKARNAGEAIKVFRRAHETIDLLITDVVLPGKNGCGLSDELETECPGLKTIFISGYPENAVNLNIKSTRVAYLAKPFSVGSLTAKVREALEPRHRFSRINTGKAQFVML